MQEEICEVQQVSLLKNLLGFIHQNPKTWVWRRRKEALGGNHGSGYGKGRRRRGENSVGGSYGDEKEVEAQWKEIDGGYGGSCRWGLMEVQWHHVGVWQDDSRQLGSMVMQGRRRWWLMACGRGWHGFEVWRRRGGATLASSSFFSSTLVFYNFYFD